MRIKFSAVIPNRLWLVHGMLSFGSVNLMLVMMIMGGGGGGQCHSQRRSFISMRPPKKRVNCCQKPRETNRERFAFIALNSIRELGQWLSSFGQL